MRERERERLATRESITFPSVSALEGAFLGDEPDSLKHERIMQKMHIITYILIHHYLYIITRRFTYTITLT